MTNPGCTDYPPDWTDKDGDDCWAYEFNEFCTASGGYGEDWDKDWGTFQSFSNNGYDASTACCSCGGGSDTFQGYNDNQCADTEGWVDKDGDGCAAYSEHFLCTATGQPGVGWHEEWGTLSDFKAGGKSGLEACCACGGGSKGTYTGTQYAPTPNGDIAGVQVPNDVAWTVASGPCTKDSSDCILSPNYPQTYGTAEKCVIGVNVDKISFVSAVEFDTEWGYDTLQVNGQTYSGSMGPSFVKPLGAIVWSSDAGAARTGWRLCPQGVAVMSGSVPSQEATPTPPAARYTWSDCICKASWQESGKTCSQGCCNFEDDPGGDYCYVEDPQCESFAWGHCRPESMTSPGCTDYPPDWTDKDGDDCYAYEFNEFCTASGGYGEDWDKDWGTFQSFSNNGYDASTACCSCGGGSDTFQGYNDNQCADTEGWVDKDGDGCTTYSEHFFCTTAGEMGVGWHEEWGTLSDFKAGGKSSLEACCACGGGSKGTYTGTQYAPTPNGDTAGVQVPSGVAWAVASGPCTKDSSDCILSPNYPQTYGTAEKCVIGVNVDKISFVSAVEFDTEWGYDTLQINGQTYSGTMGPSFVKPLSAIVWSSDAGVARTGWRLCPQGVAVKSGSVPSQEATPTPPAARYTWSDCMCKASWQESGKTCSQGCCNFEDDPDGDYCYVEDPQCESFAWGYCRPESMTNPGCTDYPPDWTDKDGDDCWAYEFNEFCTASGDYGEDWDKDWGTFQSFTNNGYDASTACCSCGGGSDTFQGYNDNQCADTEGWVDKDGDGCTTYSEYFFCTTAGEPGVGWHEEWGTLSDFKAGGKSSLEACCACGGGSKGTYTGTQYAPTPNGDTAGVQVPSGVAWAVASGPCTKDSSDCILSPNYPQPYGTAEKCVIGVNVDEISFVSAVEFDTEWGYDTLQINGQTYSGTMGPSFVKPLGAIPAEAEAVDSPSRRPSSGRATRRSPATGGSSAGRAPPPQPGRSRRPRRPAARRPRLPAARLREQACQPARRGRRARSSSSASRRPPCARAGAGCARARPILALGRACPGA
ncbi:unnamed protein product [Prorocentrum cordatum]|uniref:Cellulase n=1 Tax=Prorocentrum cordatum TaxID=2364126 RepID=A0ABN9XPT3_9DINO|nr:unnamed protein product [Polarella glacialis]